MRKRIAININFDSLSESMGFPRGYYDKSYFECFDKFINNAISPQTPITMYIIGKDLLNPEIYDRIRDLNDRGYEIGNHTWSHPMNLGRLNKNKIEYEILKCHEIISNCTQKEPKGFISPAWSTSKEVLSTLIANQYVYDTSIFPSYWLYPMLLKIRYNHRNDHEKKNTILNRKDFLFPLLRETKASFVDQNFIRKSKNKKDGILILPLPVANKLLPPYWHTLNFIFPKRVANLIEKLTLSQVNHFYYLLHPADFIGKEDFNDCSSLERMTFLSTTKISMLKKKLSLFENNYQIVKMIDLANHIKQNLDKGNF